jgi:hypothetical protein
MHKMVNEKKVSLPQCLDKISLCIWCIITKSIVISMHDYRIQFFTYPSKANRRKNPDIPLTLPLCPSLWKEGKNSLYPIQHYLNWLLIVKTRYWVFSFFKASSKRKIKGLAVSSGSEGKEVVRCRICRGLPTTPPDHSASG